MNDYDGDSQYGVFWLSAGFHKYYYYPYVQVHGWLWHCFLFRHPQTFFKWLLGYTPIWQMLVQPE